MVLENPNLNSNYFPYTPLVSLSSPSLPCLQKFHPYISYYQFHITLTILNSKKYLIQSAFKD